MILSDAEVAVLTGRQRSDAQKRQLRHMPALQLSECRFPLCRRALRCYAPPIQSGGTVAGNLGEYGNRCGSFDGHQGNGDKALGQNLDKPPLSRMDRATTGCRRPI